MFPEDVRPVDRRDARGGLRTLPRRETPHGSALGADPDDRRPAPRLGFGVLEPAGRSPPHRRLVHLGLRHLARPVDRPRRLGTRGSGFI